MERKSGKSAAFGIIYLIFVLIVSGIAYKHVTDFTGKRYILISALLFIFSVAAPFTLGRKKWKSSKAVTAVALLIYPLLCFYFTEKALSTGFGFIEAGKKILIGNYGLYALIIWFIFALTLSLGISFFTSGLLFISFGLANYFTILYRQVPILAGDVATAGTALNVAGHYTYEMEICQFMAIQFLLATLSFALFYKVERENRISIGKRIAVAVVAIVIFAGAARCVAFTDFLENQGISVHVWIPIKTYRQKGGLLTFCRSIRNMVVDKPESYDPDNIKGLMAEYPSDSISDEKVRPNVIAIMNEAFSDLQDVGDLPTNMEVMPFYDSLTENTIKGWSYVSVFGGQTASSEYEFLSGDSMAFLPAGTTPYQLYIKRFMPTLTGNLLLDHYFRAIALHPYKPNGYNRNNVYPILGFDEFISAEDFPEGTPMMSEHITDSADYSRIIEEYEKAKAESDEPFYVFNVTMQNHGPFSNDMENVPDEVKITDEELNMDGVQDYLNLIHESDKALKDLVEYFEKVDEPTVIVMFGDHEPGVGNAFYNKLVGGNKNNLEGEELLNLYHTKFVIWANYDIPEADYSEENGISINYLQALMLDAAGMKMSGYSKYLLDTMKEVPILTANGYIGADGNFYNTDDESSPYYERLQQYRSIVYNHLFDKKGRVDEFFEYSTKNTAETAKVREELIKEKHIVHAGGFINSADGTEYNYTSSVEAIENCYNKGNKFCELDFLMTKDNQLVCAHAWKQLYKDGTPLEDAVSLDEALSCKMENEFTPLWLGSLVDFLRGHEGMYIVTDIKQDYNAEGAKQIAEYCPDLMDRFIIQVYHEEEATVMEELGFNNIIFTLYRTEEEERTPEALMEAAGKHDFVAWTAKKAFINEDFVASIKATGVPLYTHTVNDPQEIKDFMALGVDGFYSDVADFDTVLKD
ncbi:sulfatase-like hydrolase/transferase [Butyrivibrio sp. FC2001]|uniref:sulfatase-like hydrolase/transferase n=1 Tax=Butyrivibrio sp. FC2001 TaxID=1280671 RepID=UPI0003FE785B|nr:sulfatase-like hydrolase/transferase [Butyrivibrio sp. FC2001]